MRIAKTPLRVTSVLQQSIVAALGGGILAGLSASALAQDATLATPGYTGLLTVPSAMVLPDGHAEGSFNNVLDKRFSARTDPNQATSYNLGFGYGKYFEASGRLANYLPREKTQQDYNFDSLVIRDLSFNAKLQLPIDLPFLPTLAVGATDVGGGAVNFKSKYVVASTKVFNSVRLSGGYGNGPQRLNGAFGGAEWQVLDRVLLLADYDSRDFYTGIRAYTPPLSFLNNGQVVGTLMRSIRADGELPGTKFDRTEFSVSVQIPLAGRYESGVLRFNRTSTDSAPPHAFNSPLNSTPGPNSSLVFKDWARWLQEVPASLASVLPGQEKAGHIADSSQTSQAVAANTASAPVELDAALAQLRQRLIDQGFERVRVGVIKSDTRDDLVVEYENNRYNLNEADGLGVVMGIASASGVPANGVLYAVQRKLGLAMFEARAPRLAYREFVEGRGVRVVQDSFTYTPDITVLDEDIHWADQAQSGPRAYARVKVLPRVSNYIGTEYGQFDTNIAAVFQQSYPLWKGAEFTHQYIHSVYKTNNFKDGQPFAANRIREGTGYYALNQSYWLSPYIINTTSLARFAFDYKGYQHQSTALLPWQDQIRLRWSDFKNDAGPAEVPNVKGGLLAYRFTLPKYDFFLDVAYHQFFAKDKGPVIEAKRFFGDSSLSLFFKRSNLGEKYAGIIVGFPLTTRQEMKPGPAQLLGPGRFETDLTVKVVKPGESNFIFNNGGAVIAAPYNQANELMNSGRVWGDYYRNQLPRMRDAYLRYAN